MRSQTMTRKCIATSPARVGTAGARPSLRRRAFTLIELLLVLVILAVLAGLVVPRFAGTSEKARITAAKTDIANIGGQLGRFEVDCGRYPSTTEGLQALVNQPGNVKGWGGPYFEGGVPKDPWGNSYNYAQPGQHNTGGYDLWSNGSNGQDDNGGGDDITNWSQQQ